MEKVEGQTLQSVLEEKGKLKESEVYSIAIDVVTALGYAWDKSKLVHRDIKPENIMLTDEGIAKVMDLGLSLRVGSKVEDDDDNISGTPQYISPEQITGAEVDIRTDFYSLGATLFHLLTGRFVFETKSLQEMVRNHLNKKPETLRNINPHISADFSRIVRKLLAKDKEKRYENAQELLKDLKKSQKNVQSAKTKTKKQVSSKKDKAALKPTKSRKKVQSKRRRKKKTSTPVGAIVFAMIAVAALVAYAGLGNRAQTQNVASNKSIEDGVGSRAGHSSNKSNSYTLSGNAGINYSSTRTGKKLVKWEAVHFKKNTPGVTGAKWQRMGTSSKFIAKSNVKQGNLLENKASLRYEVSLDEVGIFDVWMDGKFKNNGGRRPLHLKVNGILHETDDAAMNAKTDWKKVKTNIKFNNGVNQVEVLTGAHDTIIHNIILSQDPSFSPLKK